jgi:methylated-DNA-[protein]-cysteine S-methyltransferase
MSNDLYLCRIDSPIGQVEMVIADGALEMLDFRDEEGDRFERFAARRYPDGLPPERTDRSGIAEAVAAYFAGDRAAIDDLPANPRGTPFQETCWRALRTIPNGTTISYRQLAERIGRPTATRAVGLANGQNPVSLVVPCHRVIGADGSLTGYGGGLPRKLWLLRHEGALPPEQGNLGL